MAGRQAGHSIIVSGLVSELTGAVSYLQTPAAACVTVKGVCETDERRAGGKGNGMATPAPAR